MTGPTPEQRLALGVAAARAIRDNLPVDAFGDERRLKDYADIWGAAARTAILDSPVLADMLATARADALREHRLEWASWLENWDSAVCPDPPTIAAVIDWLRSDRLPFGVAATEAGTDG